MDLQFDKEIKNAQAVNSLKEDVERTKKLQGFLLSFVVNVIYLHRGNREEERLKINVHLTNSDYGKIEMEEQGCLQNNSHHLGFSAKFENYSYDEIQKIFTITGHSEKMGDYMVQFRVDENI